MVNLLWDLDGTLIESLPAIGGSLNKTLEAYGHAPMSDDALQRHIGPELGAILANLLNLKTKDEIDHAKQEYRRHYRKLMLTSPLFEGIREQLDRFKAMGSTQFVATAKYDVYAREIVQAQNADSFFAEVYGSEENGHRGNKVELLEHILQEETIEPARSIMIGDTEFDIRAGNHHNMTTIGVLWGYGSEQSLMDAGANYLVRTPGELEAVVKQAVECGC